MIIVLDGLLDERIMIIPRPPDPPLDSLYASLFLALVVLYKTMGEGFGHLCENDKDVIK